MVLVNGLAMETMSEDGAIGVLGARVTLNAVEGSNSGRVLVSEVVAMALRRWLGLATRRHVEAIGAAGPIGHRAP